MLHVNRRDVLKMGGALGAASAATPVMVASASEADVSGLPRVKQELVAPPFVPAHEQVATDGPKIIEVELTATEDKREIDDDGTMLNTLSFNGSIPGPLMICHEGDYIELTLKNPASNIFEHNIDFHASTGALGGGGLTLISPGEQCKLRWKATKAGTYIYHCAPGGTMDPLPRGLRHERGGDGAAAGWPQGPPRQPAPLRPGLLHRRAGLLRAARRRR
ncbi:MAG: multicopper oxidase domain-containing protein [Rhodospirillaceae bacterium]|nr:multicopper oxidase domain-containing protein [Rhodospirillaceae bacterium]